MKPPKFCYSAILPDGTEVKRTSPRIYTHVVARRCIFTDEDCKAVPWKERDHGKWVSCGFAGSLVLAQKQAATVERLARLPDRGNAKSVAVEIVPVTIVNL